jgi:RNA polymerase sigma-70 factor (ECF subfamily)
MEPAATLAAIPAEASALDDFDAVVRLYWPRVFRFALASLRDRDAAETLAQDCFFKAYRAREGFRGEASLNTWLMRIMVNLIRDHVRNRRLQFWRRASKPVYDGMQVSDGRSGPEQSMLAKERVAKIWTASARLPERQRTVFLLRFVEEMELLEICEVTSLKEGAVKMHLSRAVQRVRKQVGR